MTIASLPEIRKPLLGFFCVCKTAEDYSSLYPNRFFYAGMQPQVLKKTGNHEREKNTQKSKVGMEKSSELKRYQKIMVLR